MKVKITNTESLDNGKEFKVRRMNYHQVVVNYPGSKGIEVFKISDVEFICESEIDEFLIEHRYLLKIKINRGISIVFYKYLYEELEKIKVDIISDLKVLKDSFKVVNKRGYWEKEIIIMINDNYGVQVNVSGENFKRNSYNYDVKELTDTELNGFCEFNVERLKKEIKSKNKQLDIFLKILNKE